LEFGGGRRRRQNSAIGYRNSRHSTVDSGYQQTPMSDGDGLPQTACKNKEFKFEKGFTIFIFKN